MYKEDIMSLTTLDRRGITLLAIGHVFNDINQGAVPALLPFLAVERGLSYLAASGIVLAATVISAIIQPLLGLYSDQHPIPWLMPLGMLLGGLGIALAGVAPAYWMIIACVVVSGAGVASFHPESYRFANYVSGQQRATGMSMFTVGGNIGFALGPLCITAAVVTSGLAGTLVIMVPAVLMAGVLLHDLPRFAAFRPLRSEHHAITSPNVTTWSAFFRLTSVIIFRSMLYYGLLTFVPLYLIQVRHASIATANSALTLLSIAGAVGALITGYVADRIGQKPILLGSLAAIAPLLFGFLHTSGSLALICLALTGVAIVSSFTVAVVMGQAYAAAHIGLGSGITTGLAIGLGGMSTPVFGRIADHYGITFVLYILSVLPMIAAGVALTLPKIAKAQIAPDSMDKVAVTEQVL
jgi:FSR family fosmidomycin resistance protein-like MFS transporter